MRVLKSALLILLTAGVLKAQADSKFKCYFNHTVDNSVSTGVNAVNLNGYIDDTLVAYINRAKYTLDIAVYNFTSVSAASLSNVASAINNAYGRGVKIRWIYNGTSSTSNTGLFTGVPAINSGINKLASPSSGSYNIMHNKFMVVDGHSPDPSESIVWTGSTNWSVDQFEKDYDNVIIVQDSALAHAYIDQFNMMWGDTGIAPNASNSKFGRAKTDQGRHNFTIDGKQVELYFSPADNTNAQIRSTIATAEKDIYFGMFAFTFGSDATDIVNKYNNGVYVSGIMDTFSADSGYSPYPTFLSGLTRTHFKVYSGAGIYHNKYMIVDPSDVCADPLVLTGSHNWSNVANTDNDENTLIIHDASIANQYYQSFKADFASMSGTLAPVVGCPVYVPELPGTIAGLTISPNPANGDFHISFKINKPQQLSISLMSLDGRTNTVIMNEWQNSGYFKRAFTVPAPGIYLIKVVSGATVYTERLISK